MGPSPTIRRQRVRDVDFRRPSKFTRDQVRQLERSHEAFTRSVSSRLSAELRAECQLSLMGTDQLPYSVVMVEESPRDALVAVLELEPQGTRIGVIFEIPLAHAFVNRLLGGEEPVNRPADELTELEIAVASCAVRSFVDSLSYAWQELADVSVKLIEIETSPMAVELVPPSEPTLLVNMSATLGPELSIITLVIPHRSVAPMLVNFERSHFGPEMDGLAPDAMERVVCEVDVLVRAEVGSIDMPLDEVLALVPGDTIPLRRPATEGCVLHVDDVPVYTVAPGRNGNQRAVQVTAAMTDR